MIYRNEKSVIIGSMEIPDGIVLLPEERVLFTSEKVILTNERLFVVDRNKKKINDYLLSDWTVVDVAEVVAPKLKNGGKASRKELGSRIFTIGICLISAQVIPYTLMDFNWLAAIGGFFEALYFMLSMMGTVVGVYLLLGSFLNPRPHTSVLFENPGSKALIAIFDGWDNKEAEELRRSFVRIRRLN